MARRATTIAVSHGGGPMPILGDPGQAELTASLRTKAPAALRLGTAEAPRAIVLVTAHWETDVVTISAGPHPKLLYDYYGFPSEAYSLEYPAPGAPTVAEQVSSALKQAGITSEMDTFRGWDHGVFVPLLLMHPAADIPIVQVSVLASQDPGELFAVGQALATLRDDNIAIVGSGMASFHNMQLLRGWGGAGAQLRAREQHARWLKATRSAIDVADIDERRQHFLRWRSWEGAVDAHPRDHTEHFSPLVVCAGAAGKDKAKGWLDKAMGWDMETFYWDGE